jgi:hypothetical protein
MRARRTLLVLLAVAVVTATALTAAGSASAAPPYTCRGGSVPAGTYGMLVIAGPCSIDAGNVTVEHNLVVLHDAALYAAFGGSNLSAGGNLDAGANSTVVLGCDPEAFACLNDDQNNPTMSTHDSIGGSLMATGALAVLSHNNAYGHDVRVRGGGGGLNCDPQDALQGSPAFTTFEDDHIGGNATIDGWQSCWAGFFRNTVGGNVRYDDNNTFDPDGNEVQTNTIGGNLSCSGNSPKPQQGDSGGSPNVVGGKARGQCADLVSS